MHNKNNSTAIDIENVTKHYGDFRAIENMSLTIHDNEFFTLLGPSGCGKTTLLRAIAGFENISSGVIRLFGTDISPLPPNLRPVNTVFQQYALFPHMSVLENVTFGLLRKKVDKQQAVERAGQMLEMVRLSEFASRLPSQLSGGQQQRVALARALAPRPKVLLLDEPLSALDLKLRQEVRVELQQLQHDTGITFVFVTHDQEEALTMSDRIAVLSNGVLQQIGNPREIYESPRNRFVADFIGDTNLIDVNVSTVLNGRANCELPCGSRLEVEVEANVCRGPGVISIRPECITISEPAAGVQRGVVSRHTYLGTDMHVIVSTTNAGDIKARIQNVRHLNIPEPGTEVGLQFEAGAPRLLVG